MIMTQRIEGLLRGLKSRRTIKCPNTFVKPKYREWGPQTFCLQKRFKKNIYS